MSKIFCFLDIETTGLVPGEDAILEVAWAFTNENFVIQGVPFTAIVDYGDEWGWAWNRLKHADKVVRDMHTGSGLTSDMLSTEATSAYERELSATLLHEVEKHVKFDGNDVHLAGFSVHFDDTFLRSSQTRDAGWEAALDLMHHRFYDLSAIKIHLELRGEEFDKAANAGPHRALNDVFESIEQARIFRTTVGLF